MTLPETNTQLCELVLRMFRDSADQDYMFARQSAKMRAVHQFGWSSQQAIEKYLKAVILLNDGDVKGSGHDLLSLYETVLEFARDVFPIMWCPPNSFHPNCATLSGDFETFDEILRRFNNIGHTDHRYRHYSLSFSWYDLHKLDELVFQLRRLAQPLDKIQFKMIGKTNRELLKEYPSYQPNSKLYGLGNKGSKGYEERLEAYSWANFSFFPSEATELGIISNGYESHGSPIGNATRHQSEGKEALEWLCDRIKIHKSDVEQIKQLLKQQK